MKKRGLFLFLFLVFGFFSAANAQGVAVAGGQRSGQSAGVSAENWLLRKGRELIDVLSIQETKERYQKLRHITKDIFNEKEMPRLAMGKYWKELSADQQDMLEKVFFDYFVVTYASTDFGLKSIDLRVAESVPSGKDILLKVFIKINLGTGEDLSDIRKTFSEAMGTKEKKEASDNGNKNEFEILFALRKRPVGYYIRDAKFEGQSIIMFMRGQLEKEYRQASYNGTALVESMRRTVNSRYRAAEDLAKKNQKK